MLQPAQSFGLPFDDASVVHYVHRILVDAIQQGASDIHFEPFEKIYRIRFRIDGLLYETTSPAVHLANHITVRIKIMAQLDISERRIPQDGRFKLTLADQQTPDFRVSTCPTLYGEKIVVRILDSKAQTLDMHVLGLDSDQQQLFSQALLKPQGMILVTGPTGSGKTISLYTALNILNSPAVNILTIEDPVEINLPGINQVSINPKAGLTFATALRSFLRQDPDIIMVGEMRDLETAAIGIKAAQTGHLVLSTLHTNSAAETITRLMNMGIANYDLATSVSLIIAQRLARRLCSHCKIQQAIPETALLTAGFNPQELSTLKLYGPAGCEQCTHGYKGRIGIFEMLSIDETISEIILQNNNALALTQHIRAQNIQTLRFAGLNKVRAGETSLAEINRATAE